MPISPSKTHEKVQKKPIKPLKTAPEITKKRGFFIGKNHIFHNKISPFSPRKKSHFSPQKANYPTPKTTLICCQKYKKKDSDILRHPSLPNMVLRSYFTSSNSTSSGCAFCSAPPCAPAFCCAPCCACSACCCA